MKYAPGFLALVAIAVAGCSESAIQPQSSCELMTAQVCSRAAEGQLRDGTLTVSYTFRPEEARVVPLVVPILRRDGILAAVVNCYVNTDSHKYSIVQSDLSIAPSSQTSVDFLRDRHLCAGEGAFAEGNPPRIETASALPLVSR